MSEVYKDLEASVKQRTPEEQQAFNKGIEDKYQNMSLKEVEEAITQIGKRIEELKTIVNLENVTEIVSISYIAKNYFKKSRAWLAQRINGNIVNGKPAQFSTDELSTLKFALEDISIKMQEVSSRIRLV